MAKHGCCADKACNDRTCMELPAGKTCGDCVHVHRCVAIFGHTPVDTYCDWFPRRFNERAPVAGVPPTAPSRPTPPPSRVIFENGKRAPDGVQGTATTAREDAKKARPPSDAEPWIVADDEGVRVTFRSEDAAWRYRNEYTDRLTNPTVTHEPATPGVPASAPLRTALDLTLTQGEAQNIAAFLDDDAESDAEVVRLLIGDGHSGYGLYAAHPDYPGEGAMLVKNLPAPDGVTLPDSETARAAMTSTTAKE